MSSPPPLKVLISGAGIAGSVFATCLLKAYPDASITIVERDPELRLTGASVDIRSSAVDIIKWMGLEGVIRENVTNEEGMQVLDESGRPIATFRASGNSEMQSFTSEFEIFRGVLTGIFLDPVRERVELVLGETVERYEVQEDGVVVSFKKSQRTSKFDLVVAADGLGSRLRGMMLECNPQEQFHDEGVHIAYFTARSDLLKGDRLAKGVNVPGGRSVFIRPDPHPEGRTRCNLMKVTPATDLATKEKLETALKAGNDSYMQLMEEMFDGVGWVTPEVLKAMRESDDFYCQRFGQIRSPILQKDRVVLVGDAGYATPGIGTSLAIIGGYILAGEMLSHPGDVAGALERYEEIMQPFVKSEQGDFHGMEYFSPQTKWGMMTRNAILATVSMLKLDRLAMKIGSAMGYTEKKLDLPDYQWPKVAV